MWGHPWLWSGCCWFVDVVQHSDPFDLTAQRNPRSATHTQTLIKAVRNMIGRPTRICMGIYNPMQCKLHNGYILYIHMCFKLNQNLIECIISLIVCFTAYFMLLACFCFWPQSSTETEQRLSWNMTSAAAVHLFPLIIVKLSFTGTVMRSGLCNLL